MNGFVWTRGAFVCRLSRNSLLLLPDHLAWRYSPEEFQPGRRAVPSRPFLFRAILRSRHGVQGVGRSRGPEPARRIVSHLRLSARSSMGRSWGYPRTINPSRVAMPPKESLEDRITKSREAVRAHMECTMPQRQAEWAKKMKSRRSMPRPAPRHPPKPDPSPPTLGVERSLLDATPEDVAWGPEKALKSEPVGEDRIGAYLRDGQ